MEKSDFFKELKKRVVDIERIKKYLNYFDVNTIENNRRWTPLHYACDKEYNTKKRIELIKYLIQIGGDLNSKTELEYTPLHVSSMNPKVEYEVIQFLMDCGYTVNSKNKAGLTPFHLACIFIHDKKIIDCYLDNGGNINIQDNDGETPLHYCLRGDNKDILVYLIKNKDCEIKKNKNEKTVFDLDPKLEDLVKNHVEQPDKQKKKNVEQPDQQKKKNVEKGKKRKKKNDEGSNKKRKIK